MAPPTTTVVVTFNIQVNPLASLGRLTMVSGLDPRGARTHAVSVQGWVRVVLSEL